MRHSIFLDSEGRVYAVGDNRNGQLGQGAGEGEKVEGGKKRNSGPGNLLKVPIPSHVTIKSIHCGWSHSVALSTDGKVYGWGRNDKGQLGLGNKRAEDSPAVHTPTLLFETAPNGKAISEVQCGPENTVLLDEDGQAFGCGWNEHGNLGVGDCEDRLEMVEMKVDGSVLKAGVRFLAVGGAHVIIV